jgi:hypothetical protein
MCAWSLTSGEPLYLTLAADARLNSTDYFDDHIWELRIGGGDPSAVALHTTFGLRARSLRLFPIFDEEDQTVSAPENFARPPVLLQYYPNYLSLNFSPLPDIDVEIEYWVPLSKAVAGRLQFFNNGRLPRKIKLSWVAQLTPNDGERMSPAEIENAPLLSGQTSNLAPVVFLTGGPQAVSSPFPALCFELDLPIGSSHRLTWSQSALSKAEDSFELARSIAARNWEAETTHIEMLNTSQVEIITGEADWDIAFKLTQKLAHTLLLSATENLPADSFVLTRQPDQGYSIRGDGSDYNHLWNGQSPLESYYLTSIILSSAPEQAQGLLRNFLAVQTDSGFIDWKPGLAGQRSGLLATPILSTLAWRIYQSTEDKTFITDIFDQLTSFVQTWFNPEHDQDGDGIPEWDHPLQTDFEDHPIFSRWHEWSRGVEISTAESPALCAFLYRECCSIIRMAELLNRTDVIPIFQLHADQLSDAVHSSWSQEDFSYLYRDRDSHSNPQDVFIGERLGEGIIKVQQEYEHPLRLQFSITTSGDTTPHPNIFIYGQSASGQGRVEHILDNEFKWYMGNGIYTGQRVYSSIDRLEVKGLNEKDRLSIHGIGFHYQDHSNLLPLWAGLPDAERAKSLIKHTITSPDLFWGNFGIPACPQPHFDVDLSVCKSVHLPWNIMIGEGLLTYNYRSEAADLVSRLMDAIVQSLRQNGVFYRFYHADSGEGIGERNALSGLAPLGLFLDTLGVRLISNKRVFLTGFNPFPWPVTVKYRGMTLLRQKDRSSVTFPNGQNVLVDDPSPMIVSLQKVE